MAKEIPVKTHIGATYDYNFLIKELAEEFNLRSIWVLREKYKKIYYLFSTN